VCAAIVGQANFQRAPKTGPLGFFCPANHVSDCWLSILGLYSLICTFLARPNLAAWRVFLVEEVAAPHHRM
jgi:hypothetical protein